MSLSSSLLVLGWDQVHKSNSNLSGSSFFHIQRKIIFRGYKLLYLRICPPFFHPNLFLLGGPIIFCCLGNSGASYLLISCEWDLDCSHYRDSNRVNMRKVAWRLCLFQTFATHSYLEEMVSSWLCTFHTFIVFCIMVFHWG